MRGVLGSGPGGGVNSPQHWAVLSSRSAQVWALPAAMAVNRPSGASVWLSSLLPQHWAAPFWWSPQVCQLPAAMAVNRVSGAVAWP